MQAAEKTDYRSRQDVILQGGSFDHIDSTSKHQRRNQDTVRVQQFLSPSSNIIRILLYYIRSTYTLTVVHHSCFKRKHEKRLHYGLHFYLCRPVRRKHSNEHKAEATGTYCSVQGVDCGVRVRPRRIFPLSASEGLTVCQSGVTKATQQHNPAHHDRPAENENVAIHIHVLDVNYCCRQHCHASRWIHIFHRWIIRLGDWAQA